MNNQKKEELSELDQITFLLKKHVSRLNEEKDHVPSDIFKASNFLLSHIAKYYDSLSLLYKEGHQESSLIIARTILEYVSSFIFIYSGDTEQRAKNFLLHQIPYLLKNLEESRTKENSKYVDELISFMEHEHLEYSPEGKRKGHWSGKKIEDLFREINLSEFYDLGYRRLSKFSHPAFRKEFNLDQNTPFPKFLKKFIIRDLFVMTLTGLKLINEKYDLLVGEVHMADYPKEGMDFIFSFNNKDYSDK